MTKENRSLSLLTNNMLTVTRLKEILSRHNIKPLKRLGENYLIDANIRDKIIKEADIKNGDSVLEIGPGFGALTIDLAKSGAKVYAVEKDRKVCSALKEIVKDDFPNLKLICGDILEFNLKGATASKKMKVVGNLPYYITTPIIEYLIRNKLYIESILITVQKEFARRITAAPGTKDYGSISCFVQYHAGATYIYTIRKTSFYPVPEVDSSLIRLGILKRPSVNVSNEELFFKIVRGAFNQRRKSIINSLSREEVLNLPKGKLAAILNGIGIDLSLRPEVLNLSAFAKIASALDLTNYG